MITINPTGIAAAMIPSADLRASGTFVFDIYLMKDAMPEANALKAINTIEEFNSLYSEKLIYKFNSISFATAFDNSIQQRTYAKTPIDALPFTPSINGTIGWFMMVTTGNKMVFCDSVGNWDNATSNMTVSNLECLTNQENILKDVNFILRDKSTYEVNPLGIFN